MVFSLPISTVFNTFNKCQSKSQLSIFSLSSIFFPPFGVFSYFLLPLSLESPSNLFLLSNIDLYLEFPGHYIIIIKSVISLGLSYLAIWNSSISRYYAIINQTLLSLEYSMMWQVDKKCWHPFPLTFGECNFLLYGISQACEGFSAISIMQTGNDMKSIIGCKICYTTEHEVLREVLTPESFVFTYSRAFLQQWKERYCYWKAYFEYVCLSVCCQPVR